MQARVSDNPQPTGEAERRRAHLWWKDFWRSSEDIVPQPLEVLSHVGDTLRGASRGRGFELRELILAPQQRQVRKPRGRQERLAATQPWSEVRLLTEPALVYEG